MNTFAYDTIQSRLPSFIIRFCILSATHNQPKLSPNSFGVFRGNWIDPDAYGAICRMFACHSRTGKVDSIGIHRIVSEYHVFHEPIEFDWNVVVHAARILKRFPLSQIFHLFRLPPHVFGTTSMFLLFDHLVEGKSSDTFARMAEGPWKKMFALRPPVR